jgi:hypothetical protein
LNSNEFEPSNMKKPWFTPIGANQGLTGAKREPDE